MAPSNDWLASLSFADRFEIITKISAACQAADGSLKAADALQNAKEIEEEFRRVSVSYDDYLTRCNAAVATYQADSVAIVPKDESNAFEPAANARFDIGPYKGATYHQNGITSTVYRVENIQSDNPKATSPSGPQLLALKVTELQAMEPPHNTRREIRILRRVASAKVIALLETFHTKEAHLVLVFPFMRYDLPSLLEKGSAFNAIQRRKALRDMFAALDHVHSLNVIHRDIKPGNILLDSSDGPAYLADFGIAWDPEDSASEKPDAKITDVGTACYRPPELLFGNVSYGPSVDMWAAGCVVAEVLDDSISSLFNAGDLGSDLTLISSIFRSLGTPTLEVWPEAQHFRDWGKFEFQSFPAKPWSDLMPNAPEDARNLVSALVMYESKERLTAAQVLNHTVLTSV